MHPDVVATLEGLRKSEIDKTEWLHQKSLELIKKGFDSDEAYLIAYKLMGKAKGFATQLSLNSDKKEKK
jgi:hypothetical protein